MLHAKVSAGEYVNNRAPCHSAVAVAAANGVSVAVAAAVDIVDNTSLFGS